VVIPEGAAERVNILKAVGGFVEERIDWLISGKEQVRLAHHGGVTERLPRAVLPGELGQKVEHLRGGEVGKSPPRHRRSNQAAV
jgi:hypothetical protein